MYTYTMKPKETKSELLHIRVEPSVKKDFEKAAKADGRTMAGAILHLMKQYVERILKRD